MSSINDSRMTCPKVPKSIVTGWMMHVLQRPWDCRSSKEKRDAYDEHVKEVCDYLLRMALCASSYPGRNCGRKALCQLRQIARVPRTEWYLRYITEWVLAAYPEFEAVEMLQYALNNPSFSPTAPYRFVLSCIWNCQDDGATVAAVKAFIESNNLKISNDMRWRLYD